MWKPILPPFRKFKKQQALKHLNTLSFIYQLGESPILREKSQDVKLAEINSLDFHKKIKYLKQCLKIFRKETGMGRGIAAVQVGILERFSVIYIPARNAKLALAGEPEIKGELLIIINPKITKKSKENLIYPEMCMSANPVIASVIRPSWVEFEYYDEKGVKKYWDRKADDQSGKIYNRVFQHEIDHMDGIINIDLVQSKDLIFESDPSFYENAKFESYEE